MMDKLDIVNLSKSYEGSPLLSRVSLSVRSGEILCLLGNSGSGKSTLLRLIAGIEKADAGQILWNGEDIADIPTYQRNFGLMFQDYALFPHLTVTENIAFGLRMRDMPKEKISEKVHAALDQVNMVGFETRNVTDLSGGEQQRIALARALAPQPGLLMLDEPLAALDRALRVDLQEELRERIHGEGIPAIYVTHDQEEALIVSDYLALLHDGQIVQSGLTADVFKFPCNRWVASFLGMTNFIEGEVISTVPLTVKTSLGIFKPDPSHLAGNIKTGTRITLLLKPSGLSIVDHKDENNVTGLVKQCDFRGDHYRLLLETQSGKVLEFNVDQFTRIGEKTTIQLPREAVIPMAS